MGVSIFIRSIYQKVCVNILQGVEEPLYESKTPTLFVIGQDSAVGSPDDVENLRERMKTETSMVIVGGADESLRMTKSKKMMEGVTQSMVDRCLQVSLLTCQILSLHLGNLLN